MFRLINLKEDNLSELIDIKKRRFLIKSLFAIGSTQIMILPLELKAAINFFNERSSSSLIERGFNSEIKDATSKLYFLGNGYRSYNPSIGRFYALDDYSPFGAGGINPYTYCNGDPINYLDYDGHLSAGAGAIIAFSLITIFASAFTFGLGLLALASGVAGIAAFMAGSAVVSGVLGLTSGALSYAEGVVIDTDPELAAKLMIASTVFGVASALALVGSYGIATASQVMGKSSLAWKNALLTFDLNRTTLLSHGAPGLTMTKTGLKSGAALARLVKNERAGITGVNEIFHLRTCYGAFGGRMVSQGQVLSNKINIPVRAYIGKIGSNPDTINSVLFRPQQNIHLARMSTGGNMIMSGISKTAVHVKHPSMIGF